MGLGEGCPSRPEAVGDRQDHRSDVEGAVGTGQAGVHGRVRDGEGRGRCIMDWGFVLFIVCTEKVGGAASRTGALFCSLSVQRR